MHDNGIDYEKKYKFWKTNIIWISVYLSSVVILLASYIVYTQKGQTIELGDFISISSGLISMTLAIVAIIYSISESIKNNSKEEQLKELSVKIQNSVDDLVKSTESLSRETKDLKLGTIDFMDKVNIIKESYEQLSSIYKEVGSSDLVTMDTVAECKELLEDNKSIKEEIECDEGINIQSVELDKNDIEKTIINIKKGDIVLINMQINFDDVEKKRPCLIVQNNIANKYAPTVIIAPITSLINRAKLPTHVEIHKNKYNFMKDSIVMLEQIRVIDKKQIVRKLGELEKSDIEKVNKALMVSVSL
ncbi:type II toxin-antitoxin system PemK/MazF family toxin [Clostridium paraputrificum]|uniref:type II toxin-antitoxin system PemK/MazF family toxin n=1 Tax=Clostridium paraputrificum TaxID=29363 RepID=UPI001FA982FC|nr:type II toxin-antitoxin system PemK/MazF family toxin [Clostridium paraputrificum]MDB2123914.1 type II toxin-antitoxin system PemK/MazF family toxin [Clostridium paraputrificum]